MYLEDVTALVVLREIQTLPLTILRSLFCHYSGHPRSPLTLTIWMLTIWTPMRSQTWDFLDTH